MDCHWSNEPCRNAFYCDGCSKQPNPEDKPNGKKAPVKIDWQNDFGLIVPYCPTCGEMAYGTDGCLLCGQKFLSEEKSAQNEHKIVGGKIDADGNLICSKCAGQELQTVAHFHGKGFFGYDYLCKCGNKIQVKTFLVEEMGERNERKIR